MKTPLQELIDDVHRWGEGLDYEELYQRTIRRAFELLEKEREQKPQSSNIDMSDWHFCKIYGFKEGIDKCSGCEQDKVREASELNSKKTSETIDTLKFKPTELPTEKTVEERALELYPINDDMFMNAMQLARQEAYIKGATEYQNK